MNKCLRAKQLRGQGLSYKAIGAKLGCTKQRVGQILSSIGKAGEIGLKKGVNVKVDDDYLKSMVNYGRTDRKQLAAAFGAHRHTIRRHLKKLGLIQTPEELIRDKFIRPEPFGRLTVKNVKHNGIGWWANCECSCGNKCTVECYNLEHDRTKSCGCLRQDNMRKLGKARRKTA